MGLPHTMTSAGLAVAIAPAWQSSEELMAEQEVSDKQVKIWALIALALCAPIYFLVAHFRTPGEARAVAVCFGVLVIVLRAFWNLRRQLWYWVIIALIVSCDAFFVTRVSWSSKDITGPVLGFIAILDFILIYGIISLIGKLMKRVGSNS